HVRFFLARRAAAVLRSLILLEADPSRVVESLRQGIELATDALVLASDFSEGWSEDDSPDATLVVQFRSALARLSPDERAAQAREIRALTGKFDPALGVVVEADALALEGDRSGATRLLEAHLAKAPPPDAPRTIAARVLEARALL